MSGQQLGLSTPPTPTLPGPPSETSKGSPLSQLHSAGFSERAPNLSVASTPGAAGASSSDQGVFDFQIKPPPATRPAERATHYEYRVLHDLPSRLSAVSLESIARQLLASDHARAARKLLDGMPSDHVANEQLRRLRMVLAAPVVLRKLPAQGNRSADIDWLRKNARNYSGKWVALTNGHLLAADKSLATLRRNLKQRAPNIKPFLHRL